MDNEKLSREDIALHILNGILANGNYGLDVINTCFILADEFIKQRDELQNLKSFLVCNNCGKQDETVSRINCGYQQDVNGVIVKETICNTCEHEHLMDI